MWSAADRIPALDRLRSTGRRAGVDGGRAYQFTETHLLEDVCTPAGGAATGEHGRHHVRGNLGEVEDDG
ncbi:MAG: hypothetical protein K0Q46_3705, partial [Rhodococcus erythropolis]|nr:hypothetical protein [Rhodococcus erythropolis]